MKKEQPMKARVIRFPEKIWDKCEKAAAKDKSGRTKASDVVRCAVETYFKDANV